MKLDQIKFVQYIVLMLTLFLFACSCGVNIRASNIQNMGDKHFSAERYKTALAHYKESRELLDDDVIRRKIGWTYYQLKNYDKAIQNFKKSIKLSNSKYKQKSYNGLVKSYMVQGKYDRAIKELLQFKKSDPQNYIPYNKLGWLYYKTDQCQKAILHFKKSLKLKKNINSRRGLGESYMACKKYHKAENQFYRTLNLAQTDSQKRRIKFDLVELFLLQGNFRRAYDVLGSEPYLGVEIKSKPNGIKVVDVVSNSPADIGGLKSGDILTKMNNKKLTNIKVKNFLKMIQSLDYGSNVSFYVVRNDSYFKRSITAGITPKKLKKSRHKTKDEKSEANLREQNKNQHKNTPSSNSNIIDDDANNKFEYTFNSMWRSPEKTRLLSVGISEFKDSTIPNVNYSAQDARYISSFLNSSGVPQENLTCLINENASRSDILDAVAKLKMATTQETETAIFYFSGHGAPIIKDGEIVDAALVPYDATPNNIKYSGIRISNLKKMLSDTRGNWIVILDACFSGKEGRSLMAKNVKSIAVVPKDYNVAPKDNSKSYWLTSTSGDNFANSFDKTNHGLFTYYLVQALNGEKGADRNEDGLVTLEEAFTWTKEKVTAVSKKSLGRPQYPEMTGQGDLILTMPQ